MAHRFTDDEVLNAWQTAGSVHGALKCLGLSTGGRSNAQFAERLRRLGVVLPDSARRPRLLYSHDALRQAAADSTSIAEVLRRVGAKQTGGTHAYISRRLRQLHVDTSHFTGQAHMKGRPHAKRLQPQDVFVQLPEGSPRPKGRVLRRLLLEGGTPECCALCSLPAMWNGVFLRLDVDHVNGDWLDNRAENLRFLCPNCHAQTATYGRQTRLPAPA